MEEHKVNPTEHLKKKLGEIHENGNTSFCVHDCCVNNGMAGYCGETHQGFTCTRKKGHNGLHVACAGKRLHGLEIWDKEQKEKDMNTEYLDRNLETIKSIEKVFDEIKMDIDDQEDNGVQSRIDDYLTEVYGNLRKANDLIVKGTKSRYM